MLCGRCGALHTVAAATGHTVATATGHTVATATGHTVATATGHTVAAASEVAPCGCSAAGLRPVRRLAAASGTPNGCLACGARGTGMVRLLESGNEAAAAVLATALYQALPPDEELADRPGGGRKLLTFSDSRQAAAFFAPYLESSHALVRQRRLIMDGLARATARDAEATVDDLIEETAAAAGRAGVFSRRESRQGRRREAARWVLRELVALDERQSLEGLGLLRVGLGADPSWRPPGPLLDLGLSAPECVLLLTELLRTVRLQGALTMPEEVDPADEMFDPRRGPIYVRGDGAEARLRVLSWLPTRGVNKRLDYLRRLLAAVGEPGSGMDARDVLAGCWRALCAAPDGWLHATALPRLGQVHQVDHTWLTLSGGGSDLWRCSLCRRVTTAALRGVCPTLGCAGELVGRPRRRRRPLPRPVPADRAGAAGRPRAHRAVDRPGGLRHPAAIPRRPGQRAELFHHVRARRRRRSAFRGAAAEHAAHHRQLHPAGRAGRAPQRYRGACRHLRPAPLPRSVPLLRAGVDADRAGPRPLRAAGKSPHRPAARAFGGARRLLPRRQGQRGPGVEDRRGFFPRGVPGGVPRASTAWPPEAASRRAARSAATSPRCPPRSRRRCAPYCPSPRGRRSA